MLIPADPRPEVSGEGLAAEPPKHASRFASAHTDGAQMLAGAAPVPQLNRPCDTGSSVLPGPPRPSPPALTEVIPL